MINAVSSSEATDQFLTLLVAQLQNQDPLEPVGQEEFVSQLAQFSTLSGVEQLNDSFGGMLAQQNDLIRLQALGVGADLIGKSVSFFPSDGSSGLKEGTVEGVSFVGNRLAVEVAGETITLDQIAHVVA